MVRTAPEASPFSLVTTFAFKEIFSIIVSTDLEKYSEAMFVRTDLEKYLDVMLVGTDLRKYLISSLQH